MRNNRSYHPLTNANCLRTVEVALKHRVLTIIVFYLRIGFSSFFSLDSDCGTSKVWVFRGICDAIVKCGWIELYAGRLRLFLRFLHSCVDYVWYIRSHSLRTNSLLPLHCWCFHGTLQTCFASCNQFGVSTCSIISSQFQDIITASHYFTWAVVTKSDKIGNNEISHDQY